MKKLTALVLSLILLLTPVCSLLAGAQEIQYDKDCPCINIPGLMCSTILVDKTDPNSDEIFSWSADEIIALVKDAIPALANYSVTRNADELNDALVPLCRDFFETSIIDGDGSVHNGSGVCFVYPEASTIKKDSTLDFRYDWRADPMEAASQLNDFINYVLEATGCEQVTITCHSLGGVVTLSYISMYGDSKVKAVCFNTTAIYGETYTGELLSGKLSVNAEALVNYLKYAFDDTDYEVMLNTLIEMLDKAGLLNFLSEYANELVEVLTPRLLGEVVAPLFAGWLSIWDMVPDEYLDDCKDYIFNNIYKDDPTDRSGIIEKIDRYTEVVRKNREATLEKINRDAKLYVISRYGYSSIPITPSYSNLSDGTIDTKYQSFGATCAAYDSELSADQIAGVDEKYISPDLLVNASTCKFPEQTWYIRDFKHSENSDELDIMMETLLYSETQATVNTYEQYPRFMQYVAETDGITAYTDAKQEVTGFAKIKAFFKEWFELIKSLVSSIFGK